MKENRGQKNWESSCGYERNTGGPGQGCQNREYFQQNHQGQDYQDPGCQRQEGQGERYQDPGYQRQEGQGGGYQDPGCQRQEGQGERYQDPGYQRQEGQGGGYQDPGCRKQTDQGQNHQDRGYRDPGCQNQYGQGAFWQQNGQPRQDPSVIRSVTKQEEGQPRLPSFTAVFSGKDVDYDGEVFPGALLNTLFGGVELDLRHAIFVSDVQIDTMAIFGGINIKVPDYVNVKLDDTSIFGGADNKAKKPPIPGAPTIYVRAVCLFGGLEIK